MKSIKELNDKKIPVVRIDNSLEKYLKMPIFQDKVDKANEALRTTGLPKLKTANSTSANTSIAANGEGLLFLNVEKQE